MSDEKFGDEFFVGYIKFGTTNHFLDKKEKVKPLFITLNLSNKKAKLLLVIREDVIVIKVQIFKCRRIKFCPFAQNYAVANIQAFSLFVIIVVLGQNI